jgi:hypothetical protein
MPSLRIPFRKGRVTSSTLMTSESHASTVGQPLVFRCPNRPSGAHRFSEIIWLIPPPLGTPPGNSAQQGTFRDIIAKISFRHFHARARVRAYRIGNSPVARNTQIGRYPSDFAARHRSRRPLPPPSFGSSVEHLPQCDGNGPPVVVVRQVENTQFDKVLDLRVPDYEGDYPQAIASPLARTTHALRGVSPALVSKNVRHVLAFATPFAGKWVLLTPNPAASVLPGMAVHAARQLSRLRLSLPDALQLAIIRSAPMCGSFSCCLARACCLDPVVSRLDVTLLTLLTQVRVLGWGTCRSVSSVNCVTPKRRRIGWLHPTRCGHPVATWAMTGVGRERNGRFQT